MLNPQRVLLGLAASLVGFGPAPVAAAQKLPLEALLRMPPEQQKAYVKAQIAKQQTASVSVSELALDATPPVLTYFNASPLLNVRAAQPAFNVVIKGTDDLSGFSYVVFYARGPSGQQIFGQLDGGYPSKVLNGKGAFHLESRLIEPGAWNFDFAYARDVAGNYSYYDNAQLAALGNTAFTVNSSAYDVVRPTLVAGKILTPSVSLSSFARGTSDEPPFIGAKIDATDVGNTGLGGVHSASIEFCLADQSHCIWAYSYTYVGGLASTTISIRGNVAAAYGDVPGDYFIRTSYVYDSAGNGQLLQSTLFGGSTNFSTLFPSTTITLTP